MDAFQRNLTKSIENLLKETSVKLSAGKSYIVLPYIARYKEKRKQLVRAGLGQYLNQYDSKFQILPWENAGLSAPNLEELK